MPRGLLSIRRRVPGGGLRAYLAGWERLRATAAGAGAHAWLFRSPAQPGRFLEFVEWAAADPLARADVAAALAALGAAFPGEEERWDEVPAADPPPPGA